jgi:hypothetical protein
MRIELFQVAAASAILTTSFACKEHFELNEKQNTTQFLFPRDACVILMAFCNDHAASHYYKHG